MVTHANKAYYKSIFPFFIFYCYNYLMKRQVVVIHGGNAYDTYAEYLSTLKSKDITLQKLHSVGWKENLSKDLGPQFDVLTPKMPNPQNAKYEEWKIWFKKLIPLFTDDVILIGHSLGGIFLAKYLSENKIPLHIVATYLIAAPYNTPEIHPLADFNITSTFEKFTKQAGKVTLYHSKDDVVVPYENATRYTHDLPNASLKTFIDRGHFNGEHLPELVTDIQTSYKN